MIAENELPTFEQSCRELQARGWRLGEIADFEERSVANVRRALGLEEQKPIKGGGLLPYLGLGSLP